MLTIFPHFDSWFRFQRPDNFNNFGQPTIPSTNSTKGHSSLWQARLLLQDGRITPEAVDRPLAILEYHNTAEVDTTPSVSMSARLCAVCNGIFTGLLVVEREMPHHQSVASLRRSAEEGCYICNFVAVKLEHKAPNYNNSFRWILRLPWDEEHWIQDLFAHYGTLWVSCEKCTCVFNFMDTTSPDAPVHSVNPGASVTDQAVMETARSWLESCRQNHAWCEPVDPAFNPTRLIYIHDASSVQLIETKKEAKSHAYVAFSHCWGKSETLKLLQDDLDKGVKGNIEELRSLIQVQRLPTSYREAISVSLALGFRHIWIDSLCIIQNSHDDWAKESAMMKDVYANCSLNLCASAAADASEASLQHRDLGTIVPDIEPQWTGILNGLLDKDKLGPLPSDLHHIKYKLVNSMMYTSEIFNSPLNLRAWVVQERILSRRHLYMTCNQLWWECHDTLACEVLPAGFPDRLIFYNSTSEEERVRYYALSGQSHHSVHDGAVLDGFSAGGTETTGGELSRHSLVKRLSEDDMDKLWVSLVERYSRCDLTYSSDKLPALSGLAQIFSIVRGPDFSLDKNSYLAGIWRPHLPMALCWFSYAMTDGGKFRMYRPHPYRAPSWSWASLEGSVNAKSFEEPACCVVDVKVLYDDERYKAGTVKGGILHLRSRLIGPLTIKWPQLTDLIPSPSLDSRVREAISASLKDYVRGWDECDDSEKDSISYLDPLPHTVHTDGIVKGTDAVRKRVLLEALTEEPRIRLFLIPIMKESESFEGKESLIFDGLILCQVVNDPGLEFFDDDAVFQRVGYFKYLKIGQEVLDLVPERTIAII